MSSNTLSERVITLILCVALALYLPLGLKIQLNTSAKERIDSA
ncbi:hypothetical protein ACC684_28700 [Rhizobium ruizarguesonis]